MDHSRGFTLGQCQKIKAKGKKRTHDDTNISFCLLDNIRNTDVHPFCLEHPKNRERHQCCKTLVKHQAKATLK
jgi:hypothetical protein